MEEKIKELFKKFNIDLDDIQIKKFKEYYSYLIEENGKYNLTSITDFDEVIKKHFIDSALPIGEFKDNARVVDVGSGAGFPGVPIKIIRSDLEFVLVDSLNKRINFLNNLFSRLFLKNITALHCRAEDYCKTARESFDYAVSRAVAKVSTLVEYLLPLIKIGGYAVLYKSQNVQEELSEAKKAIKVLGGEIEKIDEYDLFGNKRAIIYIKKVSKTPLIYPRGKNLPKTKPII